MKKAPEKEELLHHFDSLLQKVEQVQGPILRLPALTNLTPIDLINTNEDRRRKASTILSRYERQNGIPHTLQGGPAIIFNQKEATIEIVSLFNHENLYLPLTCYLLDYKTARWYSVQIDLTSRVYEEKVERLNLGDALTFPITKLKYKLSSCTELSAKELKEAKDYFNSNWIKGTSPVYVELNSWVRYEFKRNNNQYQTDIEALSSESESLLNSLITKKSA